MADTKISQLGELAEAPASGDLVALVDVSDTTQAASGSTKKITAANLRSGLAASSHSHLAGDLPATVVYTSGSYANPDWITSLAGSKITGNISGNAASLTGTITASQVSDFATAADARIAAAVGVSVQAYDAELAALAGLTSAADRLPYFTGSGTAALATFTAAGRALVDDADASAQRTTLGLGTLATLSTVTLTTDVTGTLPVANGGTGATTASGARTALGLAIGTDVLAPTGNGSGLTGLVASQIGSVPAGVLKGSGGAFAAATAGTDHLAPGLRPTAARSADYNVASGAEYEVVSASGGNRTATLPLVASSAGMTVMVLKSDTGTNTVTIAQNGGESGSKILDRRPIGATASIVLYLPGDFVRLHCDGSQWLVVGDGRAPHGARMTLSASIATNTAGTWTAIPWDGETFDEGSIASTATGKVTIRRTGYYRTSLGGRPASAISDQKYYGIRVWNETTGAEVKAYQTRQSVAGSSSIIGTDLSALAYLVAGTVLRCDFRSEDANMGYRDSTSATGENQNFWSIAEER